MSEELHNSSLVYDIADEYRPEPAPIPEPPAWMDGSIRIGIHTSIAGDIASALDTAHRLGANALQIFSSSPRMWARHQKGARLVPADAQRFRERRQELGLGPLVIHDNYLINLASPEPMLRARSIQAFHDEIVRALDLGADFLVMHPGSGRDSGRDRAIATIAESLRESVRGLKIEGLRILLENTAGQGSSIGSRFDELQAILDACPGLPLGVCVDTAHLFEAGYDLRIEDGLNRALQAIERTVGLERVFVLHVNDSKTPLGSRVDRHEHIGKGKIGLEGFRRILNHPLLAGRAFILETPIDKPGDDRRNVRELWKLVGQEAQQVRGARDGFPRPRKKLRPSRAKASSRKRAASSKPRAKRRKASRKHKR
jgi:deoxyribonuclease-4